MLQHEFEARTMKSGVSISANLFEEVNADYMAADEDESKDAFCTRVYGTENTAADILWKTIRARQKLHTDAVMIKLKEDAAAIQETLMQAVQFGRHDQ